MPNRRPAAGREKTLVPGETGFGHILVPTDLTERTEKALQVAGKLA